MPYYVVFKDPQPGDEAVIKGFTWNITGAEVTLRITQFNVRCSPVDSAPHTPHNILIALTKTGNQVPATSWHNFALTADSTNHDLGTIDFSSEVMVSAAEAASGLVGVIIDWDQAFSNCMVEIGSITMQLCQASGGGTPVAMGLGYGEADDSDEYTSVVSGQVFSVDGDFLPEASAYHWSGDLSGDYTLHDGRWLIWQFRKELFYTNALQGVFRRPVDSTFTQTLKPLYQDYVNPGRDGAGRADITAPPYLSHTFDHVSDTIAITTNGLGSGLSVPTGGITIDATSNKPTIHIIGTGGWGNGYLEFEIDLAAALDMNTAPNEWPHLLLHFVTSKNLNSSGFFADGENSNLGYTSDITKYTVQFADSSGFVAGHQTAALQGAKIMALIGNGAQRDMFAFFDLQGLVYPSGTFQSVMAAVRKIKIRLGIRGGTAGWVRLEGFTQLGTYHHRFAPSKVLLAADPDLDGPVEYAFYYTQTGIVAPATNATAFNVPASLALGSRPSVTYPQGEVPAEQTAISNMPYGGSSISLSIPQAPPPFGPTAQINIVRKIGPFWRRIFQSADNSDAYNVIDTLSDEFIYYNLPTYPQVALNFNAIGPEGSGQATGVVNGLSWAGVNVYLMENGEVLFSQSGNAQIVEWDGIVVPSPSDSLAAARSLTVSDNQLPCLAGVAVSKNLYLFTRKDGYVMVISPGGSPAVASFPSSISGVRGVCSERAACRYLQGAVFGADDSLWYVEKWDTRTDIPDVLREITLRNRGLWASLIGDDEARTNLVVRQVGGDIWCFCEERFLHINKDGFVVYGEWADGGQVVDAYGDPQRGMTIQFSDGSLAVTGRFLTDRATNLAGDNGSAPIWRRRGKRFTKPFDLKRVRVVYENTSAGLSTPAVKVTAFSHRGAAAGDEINFTDGSALQATRPFAGGSAFFKPGGQWWEIEVQGSNYDIVTSLHVMGAVGSTEPTR